MSSILRLPLAAALFLIAVFAPMPARAASDAVHQATGLKICEVDAESAVIWTRLTKLATPVSVDGPMPVITYNGQKRPPKGDNRPNTRPVVSFPEGVTVDQLQGAAPGAAGQTRVLYRVQGEAAWQSIPWQPVETDRDFTRLHRLSALAAATTYEIRVEGRADAAGAASSALAGQFRTAPGAGVPAPIRFVVITCQNYHTRDLPAEGWKIYDRILALRPDFFVHTGDVLYYDGWAKSEALARWMWQQTYSLPTNVRFHRAMASYFMKDDHDTWMNDCFPTMKTAFMGDFTFSQGQAIFREQTGLGATPYRTFRWGKHLQIWLAEGRDFRSPNDAPDGPQKTIWGGEQKDWFKRTVQASDATFRVLISPTPLVGPDRSAKNDNHANKGFTHEGDELRAFCVAQKNMVVLCGDRHWQYASVHAKTGLQEFGCGPTTDQHAGGWPIDRKESEQSYVSVVGGFLEGEVELTGPRPVLVFRHRSVDGKILNEDLLRGQ